MAWLAERGAEAPQWYAVHTRPWEEDRAEHSLARLGIEALCPRQKEERRRNGKRQVVVRPLFPGYLFARFDLETHLRAVNYARGVRQVVAFGGVPAQVDPSIIEGIRARLVDGYVVVGRKAIAPGESVRITSGVLGGLEAVFERELPASERVVLLLRSLAYEARVIVPVEYVAVG